MNPPAARPDPTPSSPPPANQGPLGSLFRTPRPVIGMLHAPPLPGSPRYNGSLEAVRHHVLRDAEALVEGGVDGLMLENFGDTPFFPGAVPELTIAHLASLARLVRRRFDVPLGVNVLRNDGLGAVAIAQAAGAQFVRINILSGARLTDQGIINGNAHEILRFRQRIGATHLRILADVSVKHSSPLAERLLLDEVEETVHRAGADALIVSGSATGKPVDETRLRAVKEMAGSTPVFIGSGADAGNIRRLAAWADGFIIGSSFKERIDAPVEVARVRRLMEALRGEERP